MKIAERPGPWVLVLALVLAGCTGGDESANEQPTDPSPPASTVGDSSTSVPSTTTGVPTGTPTDSNQSISPEACGLLDQDEPPLDLASQLPPDYADAAQVLMAIIGAFEVNDVSIPPDVVTRLASTEIGMELAAFADAAERDCGPSEGVDGIRVYAEISEFGAPPEQREYCDQLATVLSVGATDDDSAAALTAALEIAPAEHAQALAMIETLRSAEGGELPDGLDPTRTFVAVAGLGLYAEARCGVTNSFAEMLFVGAFAFISDGGLPGEPAQGVGTVPAPADPAAATAALPSGSDLAFEVIEIDVDQDGDYIVSAVVPTGWERDDSLFGSVFEPVDGFGIFTEMTIDSGCDGLCEVTDWEARVTGADGFVTQFRSDELIVDRPTEGTPGAVMVKPAFADGLEGAVIRWDDGTDRYFTCEVRLGADDIDYSDAFVAACEAARPGWITGS
jgi:hypothetical protein